MRYTKYAHHKRSDRGYNRFVVSIAALAIVVTGAHLAPNGYRAISQEVIAEAYLQPASTTNQITLPDLHTPTDVPEQTLASIDMRVQQIFDTFVEKNSTGNFSLAFESLENAEHAGYNEAQSMDAASLYKPLAAYRAMQRIDKGELSIDQKIGSKNSLGSCIASAITLSDNPCGVELQLFAQPSLTDELLTEWGYHETTLTGIFPQTSARDQVQLFRDIFLAKRLKNQSAALLIEHLANQQITDRIPEYLDSHVMHKTGDLNGVVNSTTLVEAKGTAYALSVLSEDWSATLQAKYEAISELHQQIHREVML